MQPVTDSTDTETTAASDVAAGLPAAPRVQAARTLRRWIHEGALPPGEPLPSERVLAERLAVSRGTLRAALLDLDGEGLIVSDGGRRIVAGGVRPVPAASGALLRDAVVVLTSHPTEPIAGHDQGGWLEFVTFGALKELYAAGLHVVALNPRRLTAADRENLVSLRPRGVAVVDWDDARGEPALDWLRSLRERGVPVALFSAAPETAAFDRVTSDHEEGASRLTRWLIERGRERVAFVEPSPTPGYWIPLLRAGYERAMAEAGRGALPPLAAPVTVLNGPFEDCVRYLSGLLLERFGPALPIDALWAASDGYVSALAAAVRRFGREPNRDIWLAGYDNYWADIPERRHEDVPPVVTVDKRNREIGAALVRLLLDRAEGKLPPEPQTRVVPSDLVVPGASPAPQ